MRNAFIFIIAITTISISCSSNKKNEKSPGLKLEGSWELLSAHHTEGDTSFYTDLTGKRMIKIINDSHFAFLNHDLNKGQDSVSTFVSGGGRYKLNGNAYFEELEFCNFREWEGHEFNFTIEIRDDTLVQKGVEKIEELGVDRIITETYVRLK